MDIINSKYLNGVFERYSIETEIKNILLSFETNYKNISFKKQNPLI